MIVFLLSEVLTAQVTVNVNLGSTAPRYYYLDGIESYYDIQESQYIFMSGGRWIHARSLPKSFGYYNLKTRHKVIIRDYNGNSPNTYFHEHRMKFPKGTHMKKGNSYWSAKANKEQGRQHIKVNKKNEKANSSNFISNKPNNRQSSKSINGNGKGHSRGKKK
jgi:hypothetical protein